MTEPAFEQSRLPRLTALRAFAAAAVFFFHAAATMHWAPAARLFSQGNAGVAFFFVLSGFVLTWSARPGDTPRAIYRRRFARIYPVYLLTLVAIGAAVAAGGTHIRLAAVVLALVALQAWVPQQGIAFGVNPPAWSLSCEAAFYAAFPWLRRALAWRRGLSVAIVAAWLLLEAGVSYLSIHRSGWQLLGEINPAVRASEFALGIVLALELRRGRRSVSVPVAVGAMLVAAAACRVGHVPDPVFNPLLAPFFAVVIASSAWADLRGRAGVLRMPALVYLGEISYSFYLIHAYVLDRVAGHLQGAAGTVVALVMSAALAAGLYELVEKPARRWLASRTAASAGREQRQRNVDLRPSSPSEPQPEPTPQPSGRPAR